MYYVTNVVVCRIPIVQNSRAEFGEMVVIKMWHKSRHCSVMLVYHTTLSGNKLQPLPKCYVSSVYARKSAIQTFRENRDCNARVDVINSPDPPPVHSRPQSHEHPPPRGVDVINGRPLRP